MTWHILANQNYFFLQDDSTLFETYNVELIKKDGQSLGIRIVGYIGDSQTGKWVVSILYLEIIAKEVKVSWQEIKIPADFKLSIEQ